MEHTSQHISVNNGGMPAVLGITGGIGSGKTYVSNIFAHIGVPVYDSDSRTKALYVYDSRLGNPCVHFWERIYSRTEFSCQN